MNNVAEPVRSQGSERKSYQKPNKHFGHQYQQYRVIWNKNGCRPALLYRQWEGPLRRERLPRNPIVRDMLISKMCNFDSDTMDRHRIVFACRWLWLRTPKPTQTPNPKRPIPNSWNISTNVRLHSSVVVDDNHVIHLRWKGFQSLSLFVQSCNLLNVPPPL